MRGFSAFEVKGLVAGVLALALAGQGAAQAPSGEIKTAVSGSLAGARAGGEGKGGGFCFGFDTFDAAKLEKEIDATAYQAVLDEQLRAAAIPTAAGKHEILASITVVQADICWPNVGFENKDKIKGTVTLSMAWNVDGVAIATSGSHTQPKSGPGGVKGMLRHAYGENVRQLLANPGLRTSLATPEKIVEAPVLAVAPAAAPAPLATAGKLPVPLLRPGKPARAAGADAVTVYALEGGAGLHVRLSLKLVGEGGLVLHATDGSPMLERTGAGNLELAAFLPGDDIYYVSVLRSQTAQPASLKLDVTEPDLHLAVFASGVGYTVQQQDHGTSTPYESRSCWLEPGLKLRRVFPKGYEEITLGRGGKEFGSWKLNAGSGGARERELIFADGKVTYRRSDGSAPDIDVALEDTIFVADGAKYYRYLCGTD